PALLLAKNSERILRLEVIGREGEDLQIAALCFRELAALVKSGRLREQRSRIGRRLPRGREVVSAVHSGPGRWMALRAATVVAVSGTSGVDNSNQILARHILCAMPSQTITRRRA